MFQKAVKTGAKLRMALCGPAGSGKTWTALAIAAGLGKTTAVVDTEHGSAKKYADVFAFDVLELDSFHPQRFMDAIREAETAGYETIVLDSLSHAWMGKDGTLELVDKAAAKMKSANSFAAWKDVTPIQNQLIDTIIAAKLHVIGTMRTKTEYALERNESTGKTAPRKIGTAPIQRDNCEYEFDVVGELDQENTLVITKSRCPSLSGAVIQKPGKALADGLLEWLTGEAPPAIASKEQLEEIYQLREKHGMVLSDLKKIVVSYGYTGEAKKLPEPIAAKVIAHLRKLRGNGQPSQAVPSTADDSPATGAPSATGATTPAQDTRPASPGPASGGDERTPEPGPFEPEILAMDDDISEFRDRIGGVGSELEKSGLASDIEGHKYLSADYKQSLLEELERHWKQKQAPFASAKGRKQTAKQ